MDILKKVEQYETLAHHASALGFDLFGCANTFKGYWEQAYIISKDDAIIIATPHLAAVAEFFACVHHIQSLN